MAGFPQELLDRLTAGPVTRHDIAAALSTTSSVSMVLGIQARLMTPPYVVERHVKGDDISYSLRPMKAGEIAGQVKDAQTLSHS